MMKRINDQIENEIRRNNKRTWATTTRLLTLEDEYLRHDHPTARTQAVEDIVSESEDQVAEVLTRDGNGE